MTEDERALLLAVAKAITARLETPYMTRREIQDIVGKLTQPAKH